MLILFSIQTHEQKASVKIIKQTILKNLVCAVDRKHLIGYNLDISWSIHSLKTHYIRIIITLTEPHQTLPICTSFLSHSDLAEEPVLPA